MLKALKNLFPPRAADPDEHLFQDVVTVHTAPSGSQYIDPLDALISPEEKLRLVEKAIEEHQKKKPVGGAAQQQSNRAAVPA